MFRRLFQRGHQYQLPERLVILLTNPRSGSTWLFDAIRTHPAIYMQPQADVFAYLGMTGRRYPRDLAGETDAALRIEVRQGEWEPLPAFTLPPAVNHLADGLPKYALEKCHPHFFKHDVDGFVKKVEQLQTVRMIYQVREPEESLLSFLRYKERDASWNPHIGQDTLPAHMRRIYESILKCAQTYPGLIVDYTELQENFEGVLCSIFDYLWDNSQGYNEALLTAIQTVTRRENRASTSFLGLRTTDVVRDKGVYAGMFEQYAEDIEACRAAYQKLLKLEPSR